MMMSRGGGNWMKDSEGINQRTCINGPWTWTTMWGLTVGTGSGLGRGGQRGKNWDNCNRITIKKICVQNSVQKKFISFKNTGYICVELYTTK